MRMPVNKVVELAGVLDVDAAMLLRIVLDASDPVLLQTIERVMGPIVMSPTEIRMIQTSRMMAIPDDELPPIQSASDALKIPSI